jgi:hypothetical protein
MHKDTPRPVLWWDSAPVWGCRVRELACSATFAMHRRIMSLSVLVAALLCAKRDQAQLTQAHKV